MASPNVTGSIPTSPADYPTGPSAAAAAAAAAATNTVAQTVMTINRLPSSNFYEFKHTVTWNNQAYNVRAMIPVAANNDFGADAKKALQASLETYIQGFIDAKQAALNTQTTGKAFTLSVNTTNYTVAVPPNTIYTSDTAEKTERVDRLWTIIKDNTGFTPSQMQPAAGAASRPSLAPPPGPARAAETPRTAGPHPFPPSSEDSDTSSASDFDAAAALRTATAASAAPTHVTYNEQQYRICNTSGDGNACALHALLGVKKGGTYEYQKGGISAKQDYADALNLPQYQANQALQTHLQETLRAAARNLDSISSHPILSYVNLRKRKTLIDQLTNLENQYQRLQEQRNALCEQLRLIPNTDKVTQDAIIAKVSGTTKDWNDFKTKHYTDYSFKTIGPALGTNPLAIQMTQWTESRDTLLQTKQQIIESFAQSSEMRKAYLQACVNPSYQFSDQELAAAAHLFGYRLVLCQGEIQRTFNEASSEIRVIYQVPGHYSRCEPTKP